MSSPAVSIIVPNYNHSHYLEQRLSSIFDQTYQDFEIIILDDCSTDTSKVIIERYRNNPKISAIVYNETNSGSPFKQWEKGLQMARGEYVWIAESDDTCEPCFLEVLLSQIKQDHDCIMAHCDVSDIDIEGNILSVRSEGKNAIVKGTSFIVKSLLLGNTVYNASCAIFKRETALSISKDWINSRGAGDYFFWVLMAEEGNVCSIRKPLAYRRIHNSNVTHSADSSGSNLSDERIIVNHIYQKYHIPVWKKILTENIRRRKLSSTSFENNKIKEELLSMWSYGRKLGFLPELITKTYFSFTN